jgi:hypothetical protein
MTLCRSAPAQLTLLLIGCRTLAPLVRFCIVRCKMRAQTRVPITNDISNARYIDLPFTFGKTVGAVSEAAEHEGVTSDWY